MSTTIESLQLEVTMSAGSAVSGLDALSNSLEKLRNATKGGLGLTAAIKQIKGVGEAAKSIDSTSTDKLNGLFKAINILNGVKISASIGNQITAISTALQGANFDGGAEKMQSLVDALEPLGQLGKSNLSSYVTPLKNLPKVFAELNKIDMDAFGEKIADLATKLRPLADEMQKVANGFSAFPAKIQKLLNVTNKIPSANNRAAKSYIDLWATLRSGMSALRTVYNTLKKFVGESTSYTENLNLFNTSMGEYAESAKTYAENVGDLMGIDPSEWMRNQGILMTLATGFGIAGDRASEMSTKLTQLTYDLSSFHNIDVEEMMQKVKSGFSGELEPLRNLGYDLSQAKLEATALSLGIDKSVSSMTQAEKAQLRYYAILTQVTHVQGDMARTLEEPANQLRVLKAQTELAARSIGNIFIPALKAVLPYAIAAMKVIRSLADSIARLVGFKMSEDDSGVGALVTDSENASDALGDAANNAKKLKNNMMGFDELNVLNQGDSGLSDIEDSLSQFDFTLPPYEGFLPEETNGIVAQIVEDMKKWLGLTGEINSWADLFNTRLGDILLTVGAIGIGLAAWKIAPGLITALNYLQSLSGIELSFKALGITLFLADLNKLREYLEDFAENGATFDNVAGIISEFAGLIGDACILLGATQLGGALKVVQGVGEIVSAIADIAENGVNFDNVETIIQGLTDVAIGVGVFTGHLEVAGVAVAIQGFTTIIGEIVNNWEAIKKGDWSGVDKAALAIGAIEMIGGIAVAISAFVKIKEGIDTAKATKGVKDVADTVTEVGTTTSTLTTKLTTLVKNLGLGIAIIAEVAVAAGLIVAAIWGLGVLLEQVGEAWQPVIDNGETVAIAIGVGTALLVAIGVATALLGTLGATMCAQVGIGVAILAEIGVAAGLFIVEIWAIGEGLDKVGEAWQPVLDNGETITTAIGVGTGLLVGIGVVTALLGTATVATAGALPLAIGLGTLMLVELSAAFVVFVESLIDVAKKLSDDLHPALSNLNEILPGLSVDMQDFIAFMKTFADLVVDYTKVSSISGFAATIDTIIGFFTQDPIKKMTKEVKSQKNQFDDLIKELEKTIPKIQRAIELTLEYNAKMTEYSRVSAGSGGSDSGSSGGFFSKVGDAIGSLFGRTSVSVDVPAYASGGFPETGQMFIAREAGAEMVGSIGRRTAVANNDQIVAGIANGVAEANEGQNSLLKEQNELLRALLEKESGVYLDGKYLTNSVERYQRERGRVVMVGGGI